MALRNGLLVHGPGHWAVAIRATDGDVKVFSGAKPHYEGPLARVPGLRGVIRLGEAFLLLPLIKKQAPEVKLPFEDGRVIAALSVSGPTSRFTGERIPGYVEAVVATARTLDEVGLGAVEALL